MTPRTWLAFVALGIIWGVPYFLIKIAVAEMSPLFVAWSRITLGALVLLPIALRNGSLLATRGHLLPILAFALIEFTIPFSVIAIGEQWISSSVTGILIAMVPLSLAVIARFFGLHEHMGAWRIAGLIVGFAGVATLLGFGTVTGPMGWLGVGCMVVATLGYAIGPLIVQRYLRGLDSMGPVAASLCVASVLLFVPAMLTLPHTMPSVQALASIVVLGVMCGAVAMLIMFYLIRNAGAARASVITYINPAVAALLGVLVLGETLGASGYIAFAMILLGSWLSTRASPAQPART